MTRSRAGGARSGGAPGGGSRAGGAEAGGALAIVLHTHMPYVEGFGTWPFGEEWLWEAIVGCYLPLLDLLDTVAPPVTLSLTPVLADQLSAPGVAERLRRFIEETRRFTHAEDAAGLRGGGYPDLAAELERAWSVDYERAGERLTARGAGDLSRAFAPHASWTSSATHAVLPLLATDACARLQVETGIASHLARFGAPGVGHAADPGARGDDRHGDGPGERGDDSGGRGDDSGERGDDRRGWRGGFWLPECAYAPHLEPILTAAGVQATCVELTRRFGLGAREHLRPLRCDSGLVLFGIDRATISLVWSDTGYPADGAYRDYHRHTEHHHNPWRNNGGAYDHELALARAREHAVDFVARTRERLRRDGDGLPGGGLAVCALDTELLGHWWYEGVHWLTAVVQECSRQGLELVRLDDALDRFEPAPVGDEDALFRGDAMSAVSSGDESPSMVGSALPDGRTAWEASSWGEHGDLSTWSGPAVAESAFAMRAAELGVVAAGARAGTAAVRELLALQASDWAFMISRDLAVPYAHERFNGHRAALMRALAEGPGASEEGLGNLAAYADPAVLFAP